MPKLKRSVLSADVKPEILERLKQICKDENISQAKMLEIMINDWGTIPEPVKLIPINKDTVKHHTLSIGSKPATDIKAGPPPAPIHKINLHRFNLAEELEKLRGK